MDVLIVGASGRAAAQSAVRAGWRPWVVDLFGDADLLETAHRNRVISNYRELPAAIADWPSLPWLFTGAIENHLRLIRRLSEKGRLWGMPWDRIRAVRNPHRLAEVLERDGCPALQIWKDAIPPLADGRWMLKPRRTAGGQGVVPWDAMTAKQPGAAALLKKRHIFQERANGEAFSAVFLSDRERTHRIGVSRLLKPNDPGPPFGYGGAMGPVRRNPGLEKQIDRQGQCVGRVFEMRGLWGMDFVSDGSHVWATEVNPRYTATVELYEHAFGVSLVSAHRLACEEGNAGIEGVPENEPPHPKPLPPGERGPNFFSPRLSKERKEKAALAAGSPPCLGKVVVYADHDFTVPAWENWPDARDVLHSELPCLADRPRVGRRVLRGHPICSVLASGRTERECREALHRRSVDLQSHFEKSGVKITLPRMED